MRSIWVALAAVALLGCDAGSYNLTIRRAGTGQGTWRIEDEGGIAVAGNADTSSGQLPAGSTIEITATPFDGSRFDGFAGDCPAGPNHITLELDSDTSCTVFFVR